MQARQAGSSYARTSSTTPAGAPARASRSVDPVIAGVNARLRQKLGADRYQRYFAAAGALRIDGARLDVHVASQLMAGVYDRQFKVLLLEAMREETGKADWSVRFIVDPAAAAAAGHNEQATAAAALATIETAPAPSSKKKGAPPAMRYDLADFIVGSCNHVAHQAAVRLLEAPDALTSGSPLLLIGPCGMGKTHLLQALARAAIVRYGAGTVRYVSAESFSHEFSHAVRNNKAEAFRKTYRHLDLFCIDDIDALSTKPKTQIELQHVIDSIRHRGGRVAAAGRDHPKRIGGLNDALVSRLGAGMTARLDTPDAGTLRRMLRALAQRRQLLIDDAALEALSQSALRGVSASGQAPGTSPGAPTGCSVRELEGLLTKVQAVHTVLAQLSGEAVDPTRPIGVLSVSAALERGPVDALAHRAPPLMSPVTGKIVPRPVRITAVIQLVCMKLGVSEADLRGRSRQDKLVLARTLTAFLSKKLTTMSYPEIARAMGRPNHSTIITACQRMTRQIEQGQSVAVHPTGPHEPLNALCDRLADQLLGEARGIR